MQVTMAGEYGLLGIIYLAQQSPEERVALSDVAGAIDAPEKFLRKIFHSLTKSGLVKSYRGLGGGFRLARAADEINMLEVLEAIDGKIGFVQCMKAPRDCGRKAPCAMYETWVKARDAFRCVLEEMNIAELARRQEPMLPPWKKQEEAQPEPSVEHPTLRQE